jgi:UDP-3-O-[3-hydroxymyristoyl] glucosamine N-acyltransferase
VLYSRAAVKLREIAEALDCRLEGDGELEIRRVAGIEQAQAGDLTFVANARYQAHLVSTRASAAIVGTALPAPAAHPALLRTDEPYRAFARAVALLTPPVRPPAGVDPTSAVAPDAALGAGVAIGPFVTIGAGAAIGARTVVRSHAAVGAGAVVGEDCEIGHHVSIRERVRVGSRVVLQDGAVIGSDGFGFARLEDGTHLKIPQLGDVVVEDDVEIGANTTIDRPAVGETRIGAGTKIDNLVQIAHGVRVGRRALLAAQSGVAGSTVLEDDVVLAGQAGITGHVRVGAGAMVAAQAGVSKNLEAGAFVSGFRGMPNRDWLRSAAVFEQLPALRKRVGALEQRIADLEEQLARWRDGSGR